MMSVEIKVNTVLIGHIYLRNIKHLDFDKYEYVYHYYKPETGGILKGAITHNRGDGAEVLINKILKDILK